LRVLDETLQIMLLFWGS